MILLVLCVQKVRSDPFRTAPTLTIPLFFDPTPKQRHPVRGAFVLDPLSMNRPGPCAARDPVRPRRPEIGELAHQAEGERIFARGEASGHGISPRQACLCFGHNSWNDRGGRMQSKEHFSVQPTILPRGSRFSRLRELPGGASRKKHLQMQVLFSIIFVPPERVIFDLRSSDIASQ